MLNTASHTVQNFITASQLSIGYPSKGVETPLFRNLNLQLQAATLTCFMGPNGIGKSTLIRTLAGLQKPLAGEIHYFPNQEKKGMAMSQQIALVLTDRIRMVNMTAYELISFGRYPYLNWNIKLTEADKEIIEHAIDHVHIRHLEHKRLDELSDGQLQLVMIARALAQDTPVILLDEPTAHLDLNNRVEVMNLLRTLSRTLNKSILIATHELDLALQTADLVWLADRNNSIISGIPEDLVLNGSFDSIFQFKGFDLKTGKVEHVAHRKKSIALVGTGPELLWTKNAFERSGFTVTENAMTTITLIREPNKYRWQLSDNQSFSSLQDILAYLIQID